MAYRLLPDKLALRDNGRLGPAEWGLTGHRNGHIAGYAGSVSGLDTVRRDRQAGGVDRSELRDWISDALTRHDRDVTERAETAANVTVEEIVDAVWGRLPLQVRRGTSRAQVQASLTMLTLRRGITLGRETTTHRTHRAPTIEP